MNHFDDAGFIWFISFVGFCLFGWLCDLLFKDSHIAGRRILSFWKASRKQCSKAIEHFIFGGLRHPWADTVLNFLLVGGIGSGKTTILRLLAQQFLSSIRPGLDRRGLVYDPMGTMVGILAGLKLSCPVVSFHPFDKRCVAWDIAADTTSPGHALQLASTVIPQEKGSNAQFYSNAATSVVTGVIEIYQEKAPENWKLADVLLAFRTKERLQTILEQSPRHKHLLANYFGNNEVGWCILATIQAGLDRFSTIAAIWRKARPISIRHWANGEMPYILLLGQDQENKYSMDIVNRLIFMKVIQVLLNQSDSDTRRSFLFLDEVREASFQGLADLYTRSRAKGASITCCFQSIEGLREAYGERSAHELAGQNIQMALLRATEPATAEWMSRIVGEHKFWRESVTRSDSWTKSNISKQRHVVTEPAVLPSTFMSLPKTNKKNGLTGLFLSSTIGAWWHTLPGHRLFSQDLLPENKVVSNFLPRQEADMKLDDWTTDDLSRLGLPSTLLDHKSEQKPKSLSPRVLKTPQIVGRDNFGS